MTMVMVRLRAVALGLGLMLAALPAQAGFLYTFSFDAIRSGNFSYGAASFSFETPSLLDTAGEIAAVVPAGDLNGFGVTQVVVDQLLANAIAFASYVGTPDPGAAPAGDVVAFYFLLDDTTASGPGTYATPFFAGRGLATGFGGTSFLYTSGSLTIQDVGRPGAVPAPPAMGLLGVALLGLLAARPRRTR